MLILLSKNFDIASFTLRDYGLLIVSYTRRLRLHCLSLFSAESWLFLDTSCCIWAISFSFNFSFTSGIVYYPCGSFLYSDLWWKSVHFLIISFLLPSRQLVNNHFSPFSHFFNIQIIYPSCQPSILTCLISFSQTLNCIMCPKRVSLYIVFFAQILLIIL